MNCERCGRSPQSSYHHDPQHPEFHEYVDPVSTMYARVENCDYGEFDILREAILFLLKREV